MDTNNVVIKMIFDRWYALIKTCDTLLDSFTDEQLMKEIAPGKNRGVYVLGHLVAVHDDMLRLLDMGNKLHPELYDIFLTAPDKMIEQIPSVSELRGYWTNQCELLKQKFEAMEPDNWFQKHTAVSDEDFASEHHRNKLNIILTRTTHLAYHAGQLILLK